MTERKRRTSAHAILGLLAIVVASCGGESAATTTTSAPAETTTTSTTTTTVPTTTTLPDVTEASIEGAWTAFYTYPGNEEEIPDHERAFAFTADCSADPCEITGEVEVVALGGGDVESRRTPIEWNGSEYGWTFVEEQVAEEDGALLCRWEGTRVWTLRVDDADMIDDVWSATAMTGDFEESYAVVEQAEGVECEVSEPLLGVLTLERVDDA